MITRPVINSHHSSGARKAKADHDREASRPNNEKGEIPLAGIIAGQVIGMPFAPLQTESKL
jgi:hypothetical protein